MQTPRRLDPENDRLSKNNNINLKKLSKKDENQEKMSIFARQKRIKNIHYNNYWTSVLRTNIISHQSITYTPYSIHYVVTPRNAFS